MIVPMRRVSLIAAAADHLKTVRVLRDLGVMHVDSVMLGENPGRHDLASRLGEIDATLSRLEMVRGKCRQPAGDETGEAVFQAARQSFADLDQLGERLVAARQKLARLEPWGDFDAGLIEKIRRRGLQVYLCKAPVKIIQALRETGLICREISGRGAVSYFAVISERKIPEEELPREDVPVDVSLADLRREIVELQKHSSRIRQDLTALRCELPLLKTYRAIIASALEFVTVKDSFGDHGALTSISGYVPEPETGKVLAAAAANGWGVVHREADPEKEAPPTLIRHNRISRLIAPLFDFLGIEPGYNERDMSLPVLFFFTIFFGMLVGDAAYGLFFLTIAVIGLIWRRDNPGVRQLMTLLLILSLSAVAWGSMTNNFFGLAIPGFGIPWLASAPDKNQNVQLVCFVLGMIQLSLGHLYQMRRRSWRNYLTQIGWIVILAANLWLVYLLLLYPGPFPTLLLALYAVGIFLTVVFGINWRDVSSIFGYFSSATGSVIDLLSYIRLYAVGLSGFYLALSFNSMAGPILHSAFWPFGLFIMLIGHLLTIGLAVLGVLVHGVRLNLLEFSGHSDIAWNGYKFDPFKKSDVETQFNQAMIKE